MIKKQKSPKPRVEQKKWATFTYLGPETRTITKFFKNTDTGILFRTKNNIHLWKKRSTTEKIIWVEYTTCNVQSVHVNMSI
jgi:hypothetical protein